MREEADQTGAAIAPFLRWQAWRYLSWGWWESRLRQPGSKPELGGPAAILALLAVAGAIFVVYAPVLNHYFFGDDFVPLADVASRSTWGYVADLFLLRDPTPNWRLLPGLFYLATFRAFGLEAFPFLLTNVLLHIGTASLIFVLVRRAAGAFSPAFLAAAFFGLTAAHARTIAQVTAFNNALAAFLLMLSLVTLYEGLARGRLRWWGVASALSFAGAIASNESYAMLAPVPALLALWKFSDADGWWRQLREWRRLVLLVAPYAAIGGAALIGFGACRCTEAASVYSLGVVFENFWIYLGRLLYPIGLELPGRVGDAHLVAGLAVAALALLMLVRGPALARICVVFLLLALIPYLPIEFALAPRYVYLAAIPFSILAALLFAEAAAYGGRITPLLPPALALVALSVLVFYGWQTWSQNEFIADESAQWRQLVTGLQERYPELPAGSQVYLRGGPLALGFSPFVAPPVGEVLWSDVQFRIVAEGAETICARPGGEVFVLDFDAGRFTPVTAGDPSEPSIGPAVPAIRTDCPPPPFPP